MKILTNILIILLVTGFTACSDNSSTGTDPGQPPSIPDLAANAQPDISFFQNNSVMSSASVTTATTSATINNFNTAKTTVVAGALITAIGQTYYGFINPASNTNAEFNDGQWKWEYSASGGGGSYNIRTTAKAQSSGYNWATYLSFNNGQGSQVDNAKVMEGSTQKDGAQGDWTFFIPDGSAQKAFTSDWTVTSESNRSINATIFDDNGESDVLVKYNQDGAENTMVYEYNEPDTPNVEIFWNTETKAGYIDDGDEQLCWDGSFEDVSCSEN